MAARKRNRYFMVVILLLSFLLVFGCSSGSDGGGDGDTTGDSTGDSTDDTASPTVLSVSPADGSTDVAGGTTITITFSEPMSASTITTNTTDSYCTQNINLSYDDFTTCVSSSDGVSAAGAGLYVPLASGNSSFTFTPDELFGGMTYKLRITGGSAGVLDSDDNPMENTWESTQGFTTASVVIEAVAAGENHSCALKNDNTVWCWGNNDYGQLGAGEDVVLAGNVGSRTAVQASGLTNVSQIDTGANHTCAVRNDGTVWCWGYNESGQLGNNATENSAVPVQVQNITTAVQVGCGDYHTCAALNDGNETSLKCWGMGGSGQLGNNQSSNLSYPVSVLNSSGNDLTGDANETMQVEGGFRSTCALVEFTPYCWGSDSYGQLGNGSPASDTNYAVPVNLITGAHQIAVGANHACALSVGSKVECWGLGSSGQLGNGSPSNASDPVTVSGISNPGDAGLTGMQVTAGGSFSCVVLNDDTVRCWGNGADYQLGDGSTDSRSTPVVVTDLDDVNYISAGYDHVLANQSTGDVYCWGDNDNYKCGFEADSSVPVFIKFPLTTP